MTESFAELFEESLLTRNLKPGSIVTGQVVEIRDDAIVVNAGLKSEGIVPISQFRNSAGELEVELGDDVQVALDAVEDGFGETKLSREKAKRSLVWDTLENAFTGEETIQGKISGKVKGGFTVDIHDIRAFLPGSLVDVRPVRDPAYLEGKDLEFKIIKLDRKRNNIVVSRRAVVESEFSAEREALLESLEEGVIVKGVVKNLTDYGAFIDLGGIDGLLHVTDMSWGRVNHPSDLFQVGDEIKVKVLKFDAESERVSLGLKQIQPDPWTDAGMRYSIGKRVEGKVVSLAEYGAFVELEPGIEGLIHVSEISWTKRIKHPSKVVSVGDMVETIVLDVSEKDRKISLGMKQIEPNPWSVIEEKYPLSTRVSGTIRNITNFGIFVGLEEGIDGLVHVSDISWTEQVKHPGEKFKKGDTVEAVVLKIDKENEKFSLGIKQLEPNPWDEIIKKYPVGSDITAVIASVADFGAFVRLEEGIEGLIYSSELSSERVEKPADVVKEGDSVTAVITKVDPVEQKISLSIKALTDREQRDALKKLAAQQSQKQTTTLGDLLAEKLAEKADESEE